jgi:excisionase family DNA binding protein
MQRTVKQYCSTREAAAMLGVSVSTAQNWAKSGLLEHWKTEGGHRRISRDSVISLLARPQRSRSQSDESPTHKRTRNRLRILVVEDDESFLRLYQLRMASWEIAPIVQTASDGLEALVKLGSLQPDLIVTDLRMPDIDGFQLVLSLISIPACKDVEIIAVSGLDRSEIKEAGGLPANVHILPKPVPFDQLEQIAKELAERKAKAAAA